MRRVKFILRAILFICSFTIFMNSVSTAKTLKTIYYWNLHSEPGGLERAERIIEDLDPDFIWYSHWTVGFPMPKDISTAYRIGRECGGTDEVAEKFAEWVEREAYTLTHVKEQLKVAGNRLYIPCILGYSNFRTDLQFDPLTYECYTRDDINSMLLNFAKWGIINPETGKSYTLEETQELFKERAREMGISQVENKGIFDLSSPKFIDYTLRKVKALKDIGVKAVWYDLYFQLPWKLAKLYGFNHPMVKDLYNGGCDIIDKTKEMGLFVGTWVISLRFPYRRVPKLDFVTETPTSHEVLNLKPDYKRWDEVGKIVKQKCPNCILLIMFDFAAWSPNLPLAVFSQKLTPKEQGKFLEELTELAQYLSSKYDLKVSVAYPVHGPGLGPNPQKLAWKKYKLYDALAPEFYTYPTIRRLLREERGNIIGAINLSDDFPEVEHSKLLNSRGKHTSLDVIDLRNTDYETRLLALSLQGIVNRDKARIYVLWEAKLGRFGNPSEKWLQYYKSKNWIEDYQEISIIEALRRYRKEVNGFVVYDPDLPDTINIATTLAGIYNVLVAHPKFIPMLEKLGYEEKFDLRGKWKNKYEAYKWQLENLFLYCNKDIIGSGIPVPDENIKYRVDYYRPIRDYLIMRKACVLYLIPDVTCKRYPDDCELLSEYYKGMHKYAIVIGYPSHLPELGKPPERQFVEFASRYGLRTVLAHATSVNFSVHSQIPKNVSLPLVQDHVTPDDVVLDKNKIYIAFGLSDLGLRSMQERYYEMWDDPKRGSIKVSWWMDPIVLDFCPGIVQYYYETKTQNDFFYSAHVCGRIRPTDYINYLGESYLREYLRKGKECMKKLNLNTVAFSNHGKYDERVFNIYSEELDNVHGFFYGWPGAEGNIKPGDIWVFNNKIWVVTSLGLFEPNVERAVRQISDFIETNKKENEPLFMSVLLLLGSYPDFTFLIRIKEKLEQRYGGEIEFVRFDELISLIELYHKKER